MNKNILLIMTDQQRSDYTGYIADGKASMPNLDALARTSAYFTCCQTTNPICMPARSSLITGRYPRQIGALTMSGDLFPQIPTFMHGLQKAGYTTYGIGKFHYLQTAPWSVPRGQGLNYVKMAAASCDSKQYGYDEIWEAAGKQLMLKNYCYYADCLHEKGLLEKARDFWQQSGGPNGDTADHNYDQVRSWPFDEADYPDVMIGLKAREKIKTHDRKKPFFMFLSFCGPHKPYDAPRRYLDMVEYEEKDDFILEANKTLSTEEKDIIYRQRHSAKAMLRLIDDQIGMTLDELKKQNMFEDSLIIFTSDHGDMLGDHYMIQKGVPWRQSVNVPLVIKMPGMEPSGAHNAPVELSDIAATILDYAGLKPDAALSRPWPAYNDRIPSRSLLPIVRGTSDKIRDFAFSESDFTEERKPGAVYKEVLEKRGGGGRRTNAWQAVTTDKSKYIKYTEYERPGDVYEEFYDLVNDRNETINQIKNPAYRRKIREARNRLRYILDRYPPCQMTWADGWMGQA
ncbi:MAG: sulfatase-like hydrolase/transferase [Spirochaetaceae bacterium]|jgi:arylsulfatase A-like enzyme|nr:sulfatase-like hydrolase/transferase [Spirochaetaceae bacterium]